MGQEEISRQESYNAMPMNNKTTKIKQAGISPNW